MKEEFEVKMNKDSGRFEPVESEDLQLLVNEQRLLVFLETEPQSNRYNQVILDDKKFKRVSDAIGENSRADKELKEGFEVYDIQVSEEAFSLPDLQSIKNL